MSRLGLNRDEIRGRSSTRTASATRSGPYGDGTEYQPLPPNFASAATVLQQQHGQPLPESTCPWQAASACPWQTAQSFQASSSSPLPFQPPPGLEWMQQLGQTIAASIVSANAQTATVSPTLPIHNNTTINNTMLPEHDEICT